MRLPALLTVLCFSMVACAPTTPVKLNLPEYKYQPLEKPEEEQPENAVKIPGATGGTRGLKLGDPAPFAGILMDPRTAMIYGLIAAERDRRRKELDIERQRLAGYQQVYNETVTSLVQAAKRSWFEEHRGTLGLVAGFVIATAACIGITYGVSRTVSK